MNNKNYNQSGGYYRQQSNLPAVRGGQNAVRRPSSGHGGASGRGRRGRGPRFQKQRHILGLVSFGVAVLYLIMSTIAGLVVKGSGLGWTGLIPAIFIAASGFLAIQFEHRAAPLAFIYPAGLAFLAEFFSLVHVKGIGTWRFLGLLCAVICLLHLVFMCLFKRRNIELPKLMIVICLCFTIVFMIIGIALGGKKSEEDAGAQNNSANTTAVAADGSTANSSADATAANEGSANLTAGGGADSAAAAPVVDVADPQDGTLFLATDTFAVHFNRYELGEDVNGSPCVYIYYDFTNRTGSPVNIPSVSYTTLTQNGNSCSKASVAESNDEMDVYKAEVPAGTTVTACEVYSIEDRSQCELEIMEFVPANAQSASMTLILKEDV